MRKFINISGFIVCFVLILFSIGFSENLVVTTYYPSPYGSYQELRVNQMSIGSAYTNPTTNPLTNGYLFVEGRVGIGKITPTVPLDVVGDVLITGNLTVTGNITGTVVAPPSDQRLKDVSGTCEYGIEAIDQLNVVRYRFKKDNPLGLPSDKVHVGLIAQEVQRIIPEAVDMGANGYLTLDTTPILYSMVNAIKEQQKEIELLKKEINELKSKGKKR